MYAVIPVAGLLIASTGAALLRKVLFQLQAAGTEGDVHPFEKPFFTAWESAAALCICLPIYWLGLLFSKRPDSTTDEEQPLITHQTKTIPEDDRVYESRAAQLKQVFALSVPGLLNVLSICIQGVGLQYITATVSIMLSGSCIVFTAALSVVLLRCRLNLYHFSGIGLTLVGIGAVAAADFVGRPRHAGNLLQRQAASGLLGSEASGSAKTGAELYGIGMTLLSSLLLAGRLVAEEVALEGTKLHSFQVLGYEGLWGTLVSGLILYPICWFIPGNDIGHKLENVVDSLLMLGNRDLSVVNAVFFLSVVGMNVFGLFVTSRLGSVFRAVLLTARTASVWALNLLLFYTHVGGHAVGEQWSSPGSWIQLAGFCVLLLGTITYAQGSSNLAMIMASSKTETLQQQPGSLSPGSNRIAVTHVRPYTSLYIPNVPRRWPKSRPIHAAVSLPTESAWSNVPRELPTTLSVPNHVSLAVGTSAWNAEGGPRSPLSVPSSLPSPPPGSSPQGGSPFSTSSLRSGSFFLQSLTHRSSWLVDPQEQRLRAQPGPDSPRGELRTDLSFDIPSSSSVVQRSKYNQQAPKPNPFDESQAPSSFTFPIDMEGPGSSRRPETKLPPDTHAPAKESESFPALPHKPSQGPTRSSVHAEQESQELPASLEAQNTITRVAAEKQPDADAQSTASDLAARSRSLSEDIRHRPDSPPDAHADGSWLHVSLPESAEVPGQVTLGLSSADTGEASSPPDPGLQERPALGAAHATSGDTDRRQEDPATAAPEPVHDEAEGKLEDGESPSEPHARIPVHPGSPAKPPSTREAVSSERLVSADRPIVPASPRVPSSGLTELASSGEESSASRQSSRSRHVFGQSPTPEVLQQRRSMGRPERSTLAALQEADGSDSDGQEAADPALQDSPPPGQAGLSDSEEWANLDSHNIMFDDSDSDVSFTMDGSEISGPSRRRSSSDRPTSFDRQGSRRLQDVDPDLHSILEDSSAGLPRKST